MKRVDYFLVLQNYRSGHANKEAPSHQILKYDMIWTGSRERFDKNIRINDDPQDCNSP
jgi:hypothetical protein